MHRSRGQRPVCGGASQSWRKELRTSLRCSSCCGRPSHPFGKSSGEGALNSECSSYYKTINALWQLHQGILFVPLIKGWSATYEAENDEGVAALLTRVDGVDRRLKDNSWCSLSLYGSEGRSSKVLVADASSAPVGSSATIRPVSADETDVEVVMSVSGATKALMLLIGVKPSPFVTEDFVRKASVTTALTTVAKLKRLTLCCVRSEKRHFESALAFRAPAIVHAWSATTKQTVWIRWCRRWAQNTVTSQTYDDWCAVCGEDDEFACWEPNSCSCYTWQSPTNCHSTFAH